LCGSLEEPMESNNRTGNVGLPNILIFMWEEHSGWWAVTKKSFFNFNLLELTGQKKFSNCPKFLKHENIFKMPQKFGHKWKLSSTFIRCRLLLSKMRILKMPNKFQASRFFKVPLLQLFFAISPLSLRKASSGCRHRDIWGDEWWRMIEWWVSAFHTEMY
jgi:hypothetical protein